MDNGESAALDALHKVKRFADHAEERGLTVPLWAGLLWAEAMEAVNAALAPRDGSSTEGGRSDE